MALAPRMYNLAVRIESLALNQIRPFENLILDFPAGDDPQAADVRVFVGPNGSGKTTIIAALAQFFSFEDVGLAERMWSADSWAAVRIDGVWEVLELHTGERKRSDRRVIVIGDHRVIVGLLSRRDLGLFDRSVQYEGAQRLNGAALDYAAPSKSLGTTHRPQPFEFAAFSYSGRRAQESFQLQAIQELQTNPLAHAMLPIKPTSSSSEFVQWIANNDAKHALALRNGNEQLVNRYANAHEKVESMMEEVLGGRVRLKLVDGPPLNVQLVWNGEPLALSTLPEGVKGILSWAGDLMMRLDRIPWHANYAGDPTSAPMLLLLDEIEIHLHPKWQRLLLPALQCMVPNAQLFVTTHSPQVVASAVDGYVYALQLADDLRASLRRRYDAGTGLSQEAVLRDVLDVQERFDVRVEKLLDRVRELRDEIAQGKSESLKELEAMLPEIAEKSEEAGRIADRELRQARRLSRS